MSIDETNTALVTCPGGGHVGGQRKERSVGSEPIDEHHGRLRATLTRPSGVAPPASTSWATSISAADSTWRSAAET